MELSGVLIALIASVLVGGGLVTYLSATNKNHWIKLLLAFSGGFLLAIIFLIKPSIKDSFLSVCL